MTDDNELDLPVLLLTEQQAAYMANVPLARITAWRKQPGFPVIRTEKLVRIHAELFAEWLKTQAQLAAAGGTDDHAA